MGQSSRYSSENPVSRVRVMTLVGAIIVLCIVYLGYLFSLQIIDGYIYSMRAEQVTRRSVVIPAQRGQVYDRHYDTPIVTNTDSFAVEINPALIPRGEHDRVFSLVADLLQIPEREITRKIPENRYNVYQAIEIASGVSFETVVYLAERIDQYPGVSWQSKPIRLYPYGSSMSHIIGYVGDITPEELQILFNRGYTAGSVVGKSGIEHQYDGLLRGRDGREFRRVDATGRRVGGPETEIVPPESGTNLVLTLDRKIQELAEKALGARIGSAVVLKPSTGEILALVSYPRFDPNIFQERDRTARFRSLSQDPRSPFLNRVIQSSAVPASSFKIVMTAAVLEEKVFSQSATVRCTGSKRFGNRVFNCWLGYGHGPLNIFDGLAQSCNVFFYTMGAEYLGERVIIDYAREFGFGEVTGIDLSGEIRGLVPDPEWKLRVFNTPWVGGDTVNLSIGQGFIEVTPLQMANMVAMIVNDGVVYRPHVLKEMRDPVSGQVLQRIEPEVLRTSDITPETFRDVRAAMRGVVTDGTAEVVITTSAVEVAGKTGTGETGREDDLHSWFVAFAPYDAPVEEQVVIVVMVDGSNEWEWWAPKAANIILHGIFTGQNYEDTIRSLRPLWYL
jgi:penicillin-binding protein 2